MFKSLEKHLGQFCLAIMVLLLAIVCWQVISRYLMASPSTVSEELSRIFLMWLGLFGSAYTTSRKGHIAIDLVSSKLSPPWNQLRLKLIIVLCSLFSFLLILGGLGITVNAFYLQQTTPVLGLPMGLVYLAVPLSGFFMFLFFIRDYRGQRNG